MESNQTIPINKDYKVLVGCMTYNHSKYIVDALNGFAMQQTNFPFACIVIDDASTDGEPEVIKDWLQNECDMERADFYDLELANVFIVPHQTNANCTMAVYFLKRNLYNEGHLKFDLVKDWGSHCEYLALCEGDDYWTGPEKLQIQSDCLDAHPEVDMCTHSYREVSAITGKTIRFIQRKKHNCIISAEEIIAGRGENLTTDSIVYRVRLEDRIPSFRQFMNYDYSLYIHGSVRGGLYYFEREMSVYRKEVDGSWCSKMDKDKSASECFTDNLLYMLTILDREYNFKFHNAVKQSISQTQASALRQFVFSQNSISENIHYLHKYRKGLKSLSPSEVFNVICKCIIPKLGKKCQMIFLRR